MGGHFANTWTRLRDQATFFPWYATTPQNLLPMEVAASAERVHNSVTYFLCAASNYAGPFLAAHTFGEIAAGRLSSLEAPAVFAYASNDNVAEHFNRFPDLKPTQKRVRLGPSPEEKHALVDEYLEKFDERISAPADPDPVPGTGAIDRHYVDLPAGQILVRSCGPAGAPPIILLHDAPGSGLALERLISALGVRNRVHAPDLPGCGESDPLPGDAPSLGDFARAVQHVCRTPAPGKVALYGIGFGASVAIELARNPESPGSHLIVRGVLLPEPDARADMRNNYAPPIAIDPTGCHWYRTWLMLRDSLIYWPWYNRTRSGQRKLAADFGAERLHAWTFEVMKQWRAYHHLINAALDNDASEALNAIHAPMMILQDRHHPFAGYDERLTALCPAAEKSRLPEDEFAEAALIEAFVSR